MAVQITEVLMAEQVVLVVEEQVLLMLTQRVLLELSTLEAAQAHQVITTSTASTEALA